MSVNIQRNAFNMKTVQKGEFYLFPESACLASISDELKIVFVEQNRPGRSRPTIELPGGKLGANETLDECVRREFLEETGITAGEATLLFSLDLDLSTSIHRTHVFTSTHVAPAALRSGVIELVLKDACGLVYEGIITHAPTVSALLHLNSQMSENS